MFIIIIISYEIDVYIYYIYYYEYQYSLLINKSSYNITELKRKAFSLVLCITSRL